MTDATASALGKSIILGKLAGRSNLHGCSPKSDSAGRPSHGGVDQAGKAQIRPGLAVYPRFTEK